MHLSKIYVYSIIFVVLAIAAIVDLRIQKIPNRLTYPTMILALCYHLYIGGISGLKFSLAGLALGIVIFFIPYLKGWMGAGDAKLMGAIGAALGAKGVFIVILYTSIVGGLYALFLIFSRHRTFNGFFQEKMENLKYIFLTRTFAPAAVETEQTKLCYGIAIALGAYIYLGLELSRFGQIIK